METRDHSKNGASLKSLTSKINQTNVTNSILFKIIFVFALFFIYGCNKEKDNPTVDDSNLIGIEEIVYCQPDLNNLDLQPRFGIKTKNEILVSYEFTGTQKDSSACFFYFDKTENQGCYIIFFPTKMFQIMASSQNEIDKYVFEAEITDSLVYFRKYDCDSDKVTLLEEQFCQRPNDVVSQLRSANGKDNEPPQIVQNGMRNIAKDAENAWDKSGNITVGGPIAAAYRKKIGETWGNVQKCLDGICSDNGNTFDKTGSLTIKNIIVKINDSAEQFAQEMNTLLSKGGYAILKFVPLFFQTVHDVGAKIIDKFKPWVLYNGLRIATRNVGALNPEDFGGFYQWNRSTPGVLDDYYNYGYANTTSWTNNPCPAGYRLPTVSELRIIASAATSKKITLPASKYGWEYWSSQSYDARNAWGLIETNQVDPLISFRNKSSTALIRCVCEE